MLVRWICWEIFSLLGPMKMLGLGQKKNRNKSPPANKKNVQESGGCPSLNEPKTILGMFQPNSQWVLEPLSKIHQKTKTCAGKILLFFLWIIVRCSALGWALWAELELQEQNKVRAKYPKFLNVVTLSRPKRVFFSGKLFMLSCFYSVESHNHLLPDIVRWLGACSNNFSSFSDLLCIVIFFFSPHWRWAAWGNSSKNSKNGKNLRFSDFSIIGLVGRNWYLWIVLARWGGAGDRNADFKMERTLKL